MLSSIIGTVMRGFAVIYLNRIDKLISMEMFPLETLFVYCTRGAKRKYRYLRQYNITSIRLPTVLATVPGLVHPSPYSLHVG